MKANILKKKERKLLYLFQLNLKKKKILLISRLRGQFKANKNSCEFSNKNFNCIVFFFYLL